MFSIPADFNIGSIKTINKLNSEHKNAKIYEVYGQITIGHPIGSGRANDLLPSVDRLILKEYIDTLEKNNIEFNYTLNSICLGNMEFTESGYRDIKEFILDLYSIGVRKFTIALPSLIDVIRLLKLDIKIKASTCCQITNVNQAIAYEKMGVKHIVIDERINRDFATINEITTYYQGDTEVIVNVICHKNCIYEVFHHNQTSHDIACSQVQPSTLYYSHKCALQQTTKPSDFLKLNWVRPEDLHLYESVGIRYYKIQGRQSVLKGNIYKTVQAYMERSYDGDFVQLVNCFHKLNSFQYEIDNRFLDSYVKPYFENKNFCHSNCRACNYCDEYIKKLIGFSRMEQLYKQAQSFYTSYNTLRQLDK